MPRRLATAFHHGGHQRGPLESLGHFLQFLVVAKSFHIKRVGPCFQVLLAALERLAHPLGLKRVRACDQEYGLRR
jgi:hypothetical protein